MIVLFTDFGITGPYIGQMKAVLVQHAPGVPVVDLMHDAPVYNPESAARLLAACVPQFPEQTVFICVVDPGVGSSRKPVVLKIDDRWYVGPDNGLFNMVALQAGDRENRTLWDINWRPEELSNTFHGRDIFAPVAACLASSGLPVQDMQLVEEKNIDSRIDITWPAQLAEIIYIDAYGNSVTGVQAKSMSHQTKIIVNQQTLHHAKTFSDVPTGQCFWYENSLGLVEFAANQARFCDLVKIKTGDSFVIH